MTKTLGPVTVKVHVKDIQAQRANDMLGFVISGTPAGAGQIDFSRVLGQCPRAQSITLELWPSAGPSAPQLELEWAATRMQYLKSLTA